MSYLGGMKRRLAEVAEKVGVSEATVSRVLNDKPGVSSSTREAVLTALDVLGYERPTQLRGVRARLVGLVLPELRNPVFPALAEVMATALAQGGFAPVLCTRTAGGVSESDYVELLLAQQVSGIIFAGGLYAQGDAAHAHYEDLYERSLPAVLVNAAVDSLDFPRVSCDDAVAVEQVVGHLRALGHERIGMVAGPPDHVPSRRRIAALRACAVEGAPEPRVEHVLYSMENGRAAADRLLEEGVTGILCASDVMALGAVRAARRRGLSVPHEVSVVGYDDSPLMACTDPPLTTVRQPIEAMGRSAVELLTRWIEGGSASRAELVFEPELVVRSSTGPVRERAEPAPTQVRRPAGPGAERGVGQGCGGGVRRTPSSCLRQADPPRSDE